MTTATPPSDTPGAAPPPLSTGAVTSFVDTFLDKFEEALLATTPPVTVPSLALDDDSTDMFGVNFEGPACAQ